MLKPILITEITRVWFICFVEIDNSSFGNWKFCLYRSLDGSGTHFYITVS